MPLSDFVGTWNIDGNNNFDAYMKACGVSFMTRKLAGSIKAVVHISFEGENGTVRTVSTFKDHSCNFTLGKEFDEETIDGRKYKTTFTFDDEKLVQTQKGTNPSVITRFVKDGKLYVDMECEGVKADRNYTKA
uniref:Lipocalin/cytosolic fatty-acid binding domain-containing protein n=1 Tax=Arion vulgaris TaxID=1028688 RepID=A0A0B7BWG6_9EUPU